MSVPTDAPTGAPPETPADVPADVPTELMSGPELIAGPRERICSGERSPTLSIGRVPLASPFAIAPMAGMTDSAFRRLVKCHGGCGLVVTEMVSSEGLVRGIDRTLEYAEYTEAERPVAIQIFGGDPAVMAEAAQIVEGMGADIVDVNMGCPVPKIAKHNAGCSLMREPRQAARIVAAMAKAVRVPVTVKMRAGWNDAERNAPILAGMMEDAGAAAVTVHGRTAVQSYGGLADWELVAEIADRLTIPVLGSGDCLEPEDVVRRLRSGVDGVLVGRGILRNPWILAQAAELAEGACPREVTLAERGRFLLDYIDLLSNIRVREPAGFRHRAPGPPASGDSGDPPVPHPAPGTQHGTQHLAPGTARSTQHVSHCSQGPTPASSHSAPSRLARAAGAAPGTHDRWVINKIRALGSWYSKGLEGGSHFRTAINSAESLAAVRELIETFFQLGISPS